MEGLKIHVLAGGLNQSAFEIPKEVDQSFLSGPASSGGRNIFTSPDIRFQEPAPPFVAAQRVSTPRGRIVVLVQSVLIDPGAIERAVIGRGWLRTSELESVMHA